MLTVFERIPDVFIEHYDVSFQTWAREFRKRGPKCVIKFDRRPGEIPILDVEGRAIEKGAWLVADVDRSNPEMPRVVIRPAGPVDEEAINRHVREMQGVWLS